MRFVLDNDVPADVCHVLVKAGHQCWTVANAHLEVADDDDVSVYAHDQDACLITHDAELADRRKKNVLGQLIRLKCPQPDAAEIVRLLLPEILEKLAVGEVVLRVTREAVRIEAPEWLRGE